MEEKGAWWNIHYFSFTLIAQSISCFLSSDSDLTGGAVAAASSKIWACLSQRKSDFWHPHTSYCLLFNGNFQPTFVSPVIAALLAAYRRELFPLYSKACVSKPWNVVFSIIVPKRKSEGDKSSLVILSFRFGLGSRYQRIGIREEKGWRQDHQLALISITLWKSLELCSFEPVEGLVLSFLVHPLPALDFSL